MPDERFRLAVCLSHPIQYKVPLMRRLAAHPQVDLQVYFYSDTGLVERPDRYHGIAARWDVPLLDGYSYEFLPSLIPSQRWVPAAVGPHLNPGIVTRLSKSRFDAVIIHSYLYPTDWLVWLVARLRRIPVLFYGDLYPRPWKPIARRLLRQTLTLVMLRGCAAYLAIGSVAKQVYTDYSVPAERIFLAPYAVDNDFFVSQNSQWKPRQAALKRELGIPHEVPVVLCVAGMVSKKRQIDLVEAMARLQIPARLVLVGRGPLFEQVRSFCCSRLPQTILTGFKNQSELPQYYAVADVFALPSLQEEFGLVINEAMCAGLPIIASDTVAAARDLVRGGENGYTFPPGDVDSLARHLELLLSDAEMRQRFGRRSREIISEWSYERTVQGILAAMDYCQRNLTGRPVTL